MNKDILIDLYDKAKVLKSDKIMVINGNIIGVNSDYSILKVIHNIIDPNIIIEYEDNTSMSKFIKYIKESPNDIVICDSYIICDSEIVYINNKFQQEEIIRLSSIFEYHTNNIQPILCEEYINDFDLKSSQKSVYKINREHMIIQYGRMLPVNKKDIVTISIYPFNEQISIYKYDISKNKKYNIECYMACLNIT